MSVYDVEKVKKIVGMLQSEHEGEAAAAARMLHMHAKKQGHNVTEMLEVVFGGGGGGLNMLQYKLDAALRMVEVAKEAVAVALAEAEREKAKRIALERRQAASAPQDGDDRNAFWAQAASAQTPPPWENWSAPPPPKPPPAPWMAILRDMFDRHGTDMLTPWEQQFVRDLIDRGARFLSEKQEAVVLKIVAKYRQWEERGSSGFGFHNVGR